MIRGRCAGDVIDYGGLGGCHTQRLRGRIKITRLRQALVWIFDDVLPETSATAIFTYCIAHSINKGWIDAQAHGPMAVLGWNAVQTKVNTKGEVEGTCVGTGMSFDPAFYYNRPVNVAAAHGYGPCYNGRSRNDKTSEKLPGSY